MIKYHTQVLAQLDSFTKSLFTGEEKLLPEDAEPEVLVEDLDQLPEEEIHDDSWKNHALKFKPEKKVKDPSRLEESQRYVTHDPLLLSKAKPLSQHKRRLAGEKKMEW